MTLTPIEHMLFRGQNLVHQVMLLTVEQETLTLTVSAPSQSQSSFTVQFHQVEHIHEDVLEEDTSFPWHIIGFDTNALSSGQWQFVLHCNEKEVGWNSSWPIILSEIQ